ncbi:serine hydrolase domain-containing protein [Xanthobacteraceae bacterium A53D]
MLTRRTLLLAATGLATTGLAAPAILSRPARAQNAKSLLTRCQAVLDTAAREARSRNGAQLALSLAYVSPEAPEGQLLVAGGDDLVSGTRVPMALTPRTPFEIGSITKVFTQGLHYRLRGPYESTLGSTIGRQVDLTPQAAALELANIARYQPGLVQDNQGNVYPRTTQSSIPNMLSYLNRLPGPLPQGTCYAYSNLGWAFLAMAAVGLDGARLEPFVERYAAALAPFCASFDAAETRLFDIGMKASLPIGYRWNWEPIQEDASYAPNYRPMLGAGGIVSTGADMLKFLAYSMGRQPGGLTDPALAYHQTPRFSVPSCTDAPRSPTTAFGWFAHSVDTPDGPVQALNKNGGVPGYTSWMGFTAWQGSGAPATHGVALLANGPGATPLGNRLLRLLLNN